MANFIVDYLVIWALLLSVYALFGLVYRFGTPGIQAVVSAWAESGLAFALLALTVVLAYYVGTEALFQRTVGKLLTGTMVMTDGGQRPSLAQIVGRSCARLIPFEGFSFLSGQNPAGWHDSLSGTRVVKIR